MSRRRRRRRKRPAPGSEFKVGDVVRVKDGIKDPDFDVDIGGMRGRVRGIDQETRLVLIEWDSISLREMPSWTIAEAEKKGLDWSAMKLFIEELEPSEPRDTEEDVQEAMDEIGEAHQWDWMGDENDLIPHVLEGVREEEEAFDRWLEYLTENLTLPARAEVAEFQERGPLQAGDVVTITRIEEDWEDLYGILVRVQAGRRRYVFPLADLEILDKDSKNHAIVDAYSVWFANR